MTLLEKINSDLKEAMKAKAQVKMDCLRQIKTEVMKKEVAGNKTLSDDEVLAVISSLTKSHVDSIESFKKGGREDLVPKEEQELSILKAYLPEQLPDEELRKIVGEAVQTAAASTLKEIGKVMAIVMPRVKGKADGARINAIVKEFLK
ncbi:MAG: GatB/YqeY domain-containing protein [Candidatus Goldiibacteriota bacterium]|jgi:uncharacterized protein YqeY